MKLFTRAQREAMLANGKNSANDEEADHHPVIKLFTPDANCTWLISELHPNDDDVAFGLCDLGLGSPELGTVRVSQLKTLKGQMGLPVERDMFFEAQKPLSAYAEDARAQSRITA